MSILLHPALCDEALLTDVPQGRTQRDFRHPSRRCLSNTGKEIKRFDSTNRFQGKEQAVDGMDVCKAAGRLHLRLGVSMLRASNIVDHWSSVTSGD